MTKQQYAEDAVLKFKKIGRHVTNVEIVGNRKDTLIRVFFREKGKMKTYDKVIKVSKTFDRLHYCYSTGAGFMTKAGYSYTVTYFEVKPLTLK